MNILVDARCISDGVGGIPQYTNAIISALARCYHSHRFLLFFNGYKKQTNKDVHTFPANCIPVQSSMPNKLMNAAMRGIKLPTLDEITCKITGIRPDVVFMPNINFAAASKGIPIVLTVHDLSFYHYPNSFSWRSRLWHRSIGIGTLIRKATRLIAVSEHTRDEIIERFSIDGRRVVTIPHGNDSSQCHSSPIVRKQIGISGEYMIAPGMGMGRKNLHTLLDAWLVARKEDHRIAKMQLIITGINAGSMAIEGVSCVGTTPLHTYQELIANASALIYPSRYEGFGFPLIEAFEAGVPVIASACSSISEIGNDAYYPFDPYDYGSLAYAMKCVCDKATARCFIQAGQQYAHARSWDRAAEQTYEVIKDAYESR